MHENESRVAREPLTDGTSLVTVWKTGGTLDVGRLLTAHVVVSSQTAFWEVKMMCHEGAGLG
jgi:hypothetical protein